MTDGDCLIVTTACVGAEPRQPSDQHRNHGCFMVLAYSGKNTMLSILYNSQW